MGEIEAVNAIQEARQPEQVEPPGRIGEKLAQDEGPGKTAAQQFAQGRLWQFLFRRRGAPRAARCTQEPPPGHYPNQTGRAGYDECGAPAVVQRQIGYSQWRENGADIRAAVEDAGGQRALALREPIGDGADSGRE